MRSVVLLVLINTIFTVRCEPGQVCQTSEGINGICITIERCMQDLKILTYPSFITDCGFRGGDVYICCNSTSLNKIGYISEQKCKDFNGPSMLGVIGGVEGGSGRFPHMVALGYGNENNIKWMCGGSLISENYVLTAAHCLYAPEYGNVTFVRAGTVRLQDRENTTQDFRVIQIKPHPDYDPPSAYHDIALIQLDRLINKTESVRPACLGTTFEFNGKLSATGWGHLYSGGDKSSDLMEVDLVQYPNSACNITFSSHIRNFPNEIQERLIICAGAEQEQEKDTCQGDSGGPLQIKTNVYHTIVGIASRGQHCGLANSPAIYTRVSNYVEWIEKILWT